MRMLLTFFCYITFEGYAAKKNVSASFLYGSLLSSCIMKKEANEKGDCRMANITNEMIWQAIKELAGQLQQTNRQVEQLGKQVLQTNEQVQRIGKQVQQLSQQTQQTNEQLNQLSEQVSDMNERLTDVANGQNILVEELFENKKEMKRVKTAFNLY
jgi:methyl-accepting chemotaxis protein